MNWKDELNRIEEKLDELSEATIREHDVPTRARLQRQYELAIKCRSYVKRKLLETWAWSTRRPRYGNH